MEGSGCADGMIGTKACSAICGSRNGFRRIIRCGRSGPWRTTRHPGYAVSQRIRKRVEEVFGWVKSQAGFDQVKVRGRKKAEAVFTFATAAYNLIRIPRLLAEAAQ